MFEIGWSEILVIAVVAIVVFPSKDLPKLLRTVGQTVGRLRRMAGDFQSQFNQALREAEREIDLEETRKQIQDVKAANPLTDLKSALDPLRSVGEDLRRGMTGVATPMSDPRPPTGVVAEPAEPLKTGPSDAPAALAGTSPTDAPSAAPAVPAPAPPPAAPVATSGAGTPASAAPAAAAAPSAVAPATAAPAAAAPTAAAESTNNEGSAR